MTLEEFREHCFILCGKAEEIVLRLHRLSNGNYHCDFGDAICRTQSVSTAGLLNFETNSMRFIKRLTKYYQKEKMKGARNEQARKM